MPHEIGAALAGTAALDGVHADLAEDLVDRPRGLRQRRPPVGVPAPPDIMDDHGADGVVEGSGVVHQQPRKAQDRIDGMR